MRNVNTRWNKKLSIQKDAEINHTGNAVEKYYVARREEKRVHKKEKNEYHQKELEELKHLRTVNESRVCCQRLNKSHKDFQPRTVLCRNKEGTFINGNERILERCNILINY